MAQDVRDAARHLPGETLTGAKTGAARRAFRVALIVLPIGIIGNLLVTFFATDGTLLRSLGALPRGYLLVALLLGITPWFTGTLRLLVWSRFLGFSIPLPQLLRMTLVVDLGNAVSPTAIGGEAFRWGMLLRHGVRPGTAATLALLPKVEDAAFFAIALPFAIAWTRSWELPAVAAAVRVLRGDVLTVVAFGAIGFVVAYAAARALLGGHLGHGAQRRSVRAWGRTRHRLRISWRDARQALALIGRRGKARFALTLGFTAVHWGARYSVVSALALFLGAPFDPVLFWLLQWVVFTIMSFVPTPGATGGAEVAFAAAYAALLPSGVIGLATAAWRFFTFYAPVALAAVLFALLSRSDAVMSPAAAAARRA